MNIEEKNLAVFEFFLGYIPSLKGKKYRLNLLQDYFVQ